MFSRRTRWICASCLGVACCLFILYRFFPSLFSLLLNYSPVAVCTTLFIGILLRFGGPNVPWNQNVSDNLADTNSSQNISSVANDLSARNDERSSTKNTGSRSATKGLAVRTIVLGDSSHNAAVKVEEFEVNQVDATSVSSSSLVNEVKSEKNTIKDVEESTEKPAEVLFKVCKDAGSGENYTTIIEKINLVLDQADDSCLRSPWYYIDHKDASSDSGSDGFNLATANVVPVIDELDPLVSRDSSDDGWVASLQTNASDDSSADEEEIENQLDNEEDEDDEEAQEDKEDENKVAITWTADDQRNVVELGNSEIERNRCLENVIATRKAKKIMEKNLIDLDDDKVQILQSHGQLASVNAPRRNPFDIPDDSDESIPGSAPSVLLPRQNPFDLPFELVDDFVDNSTPNEFAAVPQRDALTRRHESFSIGSVLELKQEKRASRFKPYFIPEKNELELEDMAFPGMHREPSEFSDSKMSATSDSDTGSSSTEQEHENDLHQDSDSSTKFDAELIKKETRSMGDFKPVEIQRFWSLVNPYDDHETHQDAETDDASQESVLNTSISDGERAKEIDDGQYESSSLHPSEATAEPEEQTHGGSSEGSTAVSDAEHDEEKNSPKITTSEATAKLGAQTHGGSSKGSTAGSVADHVKQKQAMPEKQIYGSSLKGSIAKHVEEEHALPGEQTHGSSSKSSTAGSDAVHVEEEHTPSNEQTHGGSSKGSNVGSDTLHVEKVYAPSEEQTHDGLSEGSTVGSDAVHVEKEHAPQEEQTHGGSSEGSTIGSDAVHVKEEHTPEEQTHGGSSEDSTAGSDAVHVEEEHAPPEEQTHGGSSEDSTAGSDAVHVEEEHAPPEEQTHGGSSKGSPAGSDAVHVEKEHSPPGEQTHGGSSKGLPAGSVVVVHAEDEHAPPKEQTHGGSSKGATAGFDAVYVEEEKHSHESHVVEPVYDSSPTSSERSHPNAALDEALHIPDKEGGSPPAAITEKNAVSDESRTQESVTSANSTTWVAPSSMAFVEQNESVTEEVSVINELDVIGDELSRVHEDFGEPVLAVLPEAEAVPVMVESNVSSVDAKPGEDS